MLRPNRRKRETGRSSPVTCHRRSAVVFLVGGNRGDIARLRRGRLPIHLVG